ATSTLVGNQAIEAAAIEWVVELERRAGRIALDRRYDAAYPADLESPPRIIEVKAFGGSARTGSLWLEVAQVEEARQNPNFWVYGVENLRHGDPGQFRL